MPSNILPQPAESVLALVAKHTASTGHSPRNVILFRAHSIPDFLQIFRGSTPDNAEAGAAKVAEEIYLLQAHGVNVTVVSLYAEQLFDWLKENEKAVTSASALSEFACQHARSHPEDTTLYGGMPLPPVAVSGTVNERGSRWAVSLRPTEKNPLLLACSVPHNITVNPGAPVTASVFPWTPNVGSLDADDPEIRKLLLQMFRVTVKQAAADEFSDKQVIDPKALDLTLANTKRQPILEDPHHYGIFPPPEHLLVQDRFIGFTALVRTTAPQAIAVVRLDAPIPEVVNVQWLGVKADDTFNYVAAVGEMNKFLAHEYDPTKVEEHPAA